MSIYLRGSTWYVDVLKDGKRHRISTGTTDKVQAELMAARIRAGETVTRESPNGVTLKDAIDRAWATEWHGLKDQQGRRQHTLEVLKYFGAGRRLASIAHADLERWVLELRKAGNSPATINRKMNVVGRVLRLARDRWGILDRIPVVPHLDEQEGRRDRKPLTPAQVQALLETEPSDDLRGLWMALLDTGARIGELLELQWPQVRDGGQSIVLLDRKGSDLLGLPTTRRLRAELSRLQGLGYSKPWPMSYEYYLLRFKEACSRAGIGLERGTGLHVQRHTCATTLLSKGVPIAAVQGMLGHRSAKTTEIYAKITGSSLRAAVQALEED